MVVIIKVVNADEFGLKGPDEIGHGADHIGGFFTALGKVLPEVGKRGAVGGDGINGNGGRDAGGTFTDIISSFETEKYKGDGGGNNKGF